MNAEIITIGTELLLGEIIDTNSAHIARTIRDIGLDLFYQTTVGDNQQRAAAAINLALGRANVVITTGGLGPTADDVTREAVATATNRPLELRPDLLEQIAARFRRWGAEMSPNNRQQALVPAGATALENPVGTAPCFILETERGMVISLPGVPKEMEHILEKSVVPFLQKKMDSPAVILSRSLRTAGIGESRIDAQIRDLEQLSNPTVGLAAHSGQVDIRITAKADSVEAAEALLEPLALEIRNRLGINIYGEGTDTIEETVLKLFDTQGVTLAVAEAGTEGITTRRLADLNIGEKALVFSASHSDWAHLSAQLELSSIDAAECRLKDRAQAAASRIRTMSGAEVGLSVLVENDNGYPIFLGLAFTTSSGQRSIARQYGGPPENAILWASTTAFDLLRRWFLGKDRSLT